MKLLRIAELFHTNLIREVYVASPSLKDLPYEEQLGEIFSRSWIYSNHFSREMGKRGYEAREIIYDLEVLQKSWAREHGAAFRPGRWAVDILIEQIRAYRPDVLYFQDTNSLPYAVRKNLRSMFPFIKLIVIYRGSSSNMEPVGDADLLLLGIPSLVRRYRHFGCDAHLVYHAFNDAALKTVQGNDEAGRFDVTFTGSSGYGKGIVHRSRYWWLYELLRRTPVEMWLDEIELTPKTRLRFMTELALYRILKGAYRGFHHDRLYDLLDHPRLSKKVRRLTLEIYREGRRDLRAFHRDPPRETWPDRPLRALFPSRCHPPLYGMDMYRLLACSDISLNKHPDSALESIGNMRMFEATGMGSCLLTDKGSNLEDLFEEDKEVVTYTSVEECIEKMSYLLANEEERKGIAKAGQRRTLRQHTYANRCAEIDEIMRRRL